MRSLALVCALAALASVPRSAARAQAGTGLVTGTVIDAGSRLPLSDVTVRVEGTRHGALTGADGQFRIAGVPAGSYSLLAQRAGLGDARDSISVTAGDSAIVRLALSARAAIIAPVVVSATREAQRRADASVTIDVLDGAEVRLARASHPAGVMNRIPGVHVSELSGEGHSMAIRQPITTKPMYLYLEDGIPTRATGFFNHNALYEINVPQSGGIEVLKGPGTALYGSDAIGGVVNVLTRPAPATPSGELSLEGGAFGYRRLLATGGFTRGGDGVRADLNLTRSDNWKDAAPYDRTSATARWDHFGVSGWALRTVVTGSTIDQQDVPALDSAQFDTARSLNRAPIAYRRVRALRASSALERERGATLWSVTPYARYDVLELIPSWQLNYDPQRWDTRNSSLGVLAKYRRDFAPLRARLIVGTDADWSPGSFVARRVVTQAAGPQKIYSSYTEGETQYDYDVTYRSLSPYVHAEGSPLRRLRLDAGLRYDLIGYDYTTALAPLDTGRHRVPASTRVRYSHLSPKVGMNLELSTGLNAFASYRHGFRAPSQGQLFQQNAASNTVDLQPVTVGSAEIGVRGQTGRRLAWQLSAYDMTISDDIITYQRSRFERVALNAGKTRHRGVEGGVGAAVAPWLRLDASYAISRQRFVEWKPSANQDYAGQEIEQAPRELASILATFTPRLLAGGRIAAEWSHTGRYVTGYDRDAATGAVTPRHYDGYDVLNLHASLFVRQRLELFARAVNVTDRAYAELVSYDPFQRSQFTPGAPRALFAGARWQVGR